MQSRQQLQDSDWMLLSAAQSHTVGAEVSPAVGDLQLGVEAVGARVGPVHQGAVASHALGRAPLDVVEALATGGKVKGALLALRAAVAHSGVSPGARRGVQAVSTWVATNPAVLKAQAASMTVLPVGLVHCDEVRDAAGPRLTQSTRLAEGAVASRLSAGTCKQRTEM